MFGIFQQVVDTDAEGTEFCETVQVDGKTEDVALGEDQNVTTEEVICDFGILYSKLTKSKKFLPHREMNFM